MARALTPIDACAIMNALSKQATGAEVLGGVNASNFVSVGETVLRSGTENTINSLSIVLGKTILAIRPKKAKLAIIDALNSEQYSNRIRKISYYARNAQESGAYNTDQNTNFAPGYDNGSNGGASLPTMWEQNPPLALEMNFAGTDTWQESTTYYLHALKVAFRSPEEFAEFVGGIATAKGNDIERRKEAFNRMLLLNYMAGIYDLDAANANGRAVNLTTVFNEKYGTNYTSAEIRTEHRKELLAVLVAQIKNDSDYLTEESTYYHWNLTKTVNGETYDLLRHTPKENQRLIMYKPLFTEAESMVMPEIFNPQYLSVENYEGVNFWQHNAGNSDDSAKINFTPAIPNVDSPAEQTTGAAVALDYVIGVLYDSDAIMIDHQLEDSYSTPIEARKRYYNVWWTFAKNAINDFTENGILYYMADTTEG